MPGGWPGCRQAPSCPGSGLGEAARLGEVEEPEGGWTRGWFIERLQRVGLRRPQTPSVVSFGTCGAGVPILLSKRRSR